MRVSLDQQTVDHVRSIFFEERCDWYAKLYLRLELVYDFIRLSIQPDTLRLTRRYDLFIFK